MPTKLKVIDCSWWSARISKKSSPPPATASASTTFVKMTLNVDSTQEDESRLLIASAEGLEKFRRALNWPSSSRRAASWFLFQSEAKSAGILNIYTSSSRSTPTTLPENSRPALSRARRVGGSTADSNSTSRL